MEQNLQQLLQEEDCLDKCLHRQEVSLVILLLNLPEVVYLEVLQQLRLQVVVVVVDSSEVILLRLLLEVVYLEEILKLEELQEDYLEDNNLITKEVYS